MKNAIFIHAANMETDNYGHPTLGLCQDILDRMAYFMDKANIYDDVELIHLGYTGKEGLKFTCPKSKVVYYSDDVYKWEFPTMQSLREYAKANPDANVCYLHTQAVSQGYQHPKKTMLDQRRDYHFYWNIYKYKIALGHLQKFDTCGAMLVPLNAEVTVNPDGSPKLGKIGEPPVWHYSQNFWWARADYVNTLPDPETYPLILDKRHQAEFWLCSSALHGRHKPSHNLYESWCYAEDFRPELYMSAEDYSNLI